MRKHGFCSLRCLIRKQKQAATPKTPVDAARRFAQEAAQLAANTRCHDVAILDVRGLSPVCDYFVLASGTSTRQMRGVADEIAELGKTHQFIAMHRDGYEGESWILLDCFDVVVHIFSDEARTFYDLDNLWGDTPRIEVTAQTGDTKAT